MENQDFKEKRHYQGGTKSDIINFPISLRRGLLSSKTDKEVLHAPVTALRIIFKVVHDISYDQFRPGNKNQIKQLNLFEDDFKTEHNTYAKFTFKISDIVDKDDYTNVKRGLEFLENFQKGWYKSVNSKGKVIKSYGGFITNANVSEGKISFLISSYWLEKVMLIEKYNAAYTQIAWKFSQSKQILFYLWLLELPETGTKVSFHKLQDAYEYNYKDPHTFAKNVLKSLRKKLDRYANRSFNYSVNGEMINIMPYYTKDSDIKLEKETSFNQEVTQKLSYWKKRHSLNKDQVAILKSIINIEPGSFNLFKASYSRIIQIYREQKRKVTELEGDAFIEIFQEEIIFTYKNSAWGKLQPEAYPIIK